MKRVNNADVYVKLNPKIINVNNFTIKFYTVNAESFFIYKTNEDVIPIQREATIDDVDAIISGDTAVTEYYIRLYWSELLTLGEGVLQYLVLNSTKYLDRTTEFYINSNVIVDDESGSTYTEVIAELGAKIDGEIERSTSADTEHQEAINDEIATRQQNVLDLTDLLVNDYYTKTEVDNRIESASTPTDLSNYYTKSEVDTAIANVDVTDQLSGYVETTDFNTYSGATDTKINSKLDATAYTPTDLSNYYNKSQVYNKTEVDTTIGTVNGKISSISGVVDTKLDSTAYTPTDLSDYYTKTEVDDKITQSGTFDPTLYYNKTDVDGKVSTLSGAIDTKLDATAYTPTDLSNYYQKSQTSGATEISTALASKLDSTAYTPTDLTNYYTKSETSGSTEISNALASKLDTTAYTPTDLSNYYTKSEVDAKVADSGTFDPTQYYTKTDVDAAISGKVESADLASVATSGDYDDLTNKPTLFSGSYNDLTNKPTLFSGDYNDLSNKPTIPTVPTNVSDFTNDAGYLTQHQDISGKLNVSDFNSYTAATNTTIGSKLDTTAFTAYSATVDSDLTALKSVSGNSGSNVQSNWSEIDSSSPGYIVDRPFGTYKGTYFIQDVTANDRTSYSPYDYSSVPFTGTNTLASGDTIIICVDDYKEIVTLNQDESGDYTFIRSEIPGASGKPRVSYTYNVTQSALYINYQKDVTTGIPTISIFKIDSGGTDTLTIDINDTLNLYSKSVIDLKLTNSDWESNNITDSGNIKNKPFGKDRVSLVYNTSETSFYHSNGSTMLLDDGRYYTYSSSWNDCQLKVGNKYYVFLNDVYYGTIIPSYQSYSRWYTENIDINDTSRPRLDYNGDNLIWGSGYDYGNSGYAYLGIIYDSSHIICNNGGSSWYPNIKVYQSDVSGDTFITIPIKSEYVDYNSYVTNKRILNKPFGDVISSTTTYDIAKTFVDESSMSFVQTGPTHGGGGLTFSEDWSLGDNITLELDGVNLGTAEVISSSTTTRVEAGVGEYDGYYFRSSWLIYKGNYGYTLAVNGTTSGTHSVKVYIGSANTTTFDAIVKLDSKYVDQNGYSNLNIDAEDKPFGNYKFDAQSNIFDFYTSLSDSYGSTAYSQHFISAFTPSQSVDFVNQVKELGYLELYVDDVLIERIKPTLSIDNPSGMSERCGKIIGNSQYYYTTGNTELYMWKFERISTMGGSPGQVTFSFQTNAFSKELQSTPLTNCFDGNTHHFVLKFGKWEIRTKKLNLSYLPIWTGTETEYNQITTKDNSTIYLLLEDND